MMTTKKSLFIFLAIISIALFGSCNHEVNNKKTVQKTTQTEYLFNQGEIFGTFYNIQYQYSQDLQEEIQKELDLVNMSLSTYQPSSILSKINQNQEVILDHHFITCFNRGYEISEQTNGAFDMTVTNLVNAWGFGFKKSVFPNKEIIDSLMQFVGYKNVNLTNNKISKTNPNFMLDASAIAKGYGVDVVADLLKSKGIQNYLVEIGGEVSLKGLSKKNRKWTIGIDKPEEGTLSSDGEYQVIIAIDSGAIATSGDYRQFFYKDGKKYSHTIDPKTGFPVSHGILSATIYSKDCMSADAYATSFMVMGPEKVKEFSIKHPELGIYIIYAKDSLNTEVWMNDKFNDIVLK